MAIVDSTPNPSTRCAIAVATPLPAYLSKSEVNLSTPIDADAIVRELIANAGVLPDVGPAGECFVLAVLPQHLLQALSAYVPPAPRPMPLLEWRA